MKKLALLASLILITGVASAETITLTSGKVIEGQIVERTDDLIKVDVGAGVVVTYYLDEVQNTGTNGLSGATTDNASVREIQGVIGDESKASELVDQGKRCIVQNEFELAEKEFLKALDIVPEFYKAHFGLGLICYSVKKDYDKAIGEFEKAIDNYPRTEKDEEIDLAKLYLRRGEAYARVGELSKATQTYTNPGPYPPTYFQQQEIAEIVNKNIGYVNLAIDDFSKVIELRPDFGDAYYNRAVMKFLKENIQGSWDDAKKWSNSGGVKNPQFYGALFGAVDRLGIKH